ncbi:hypothetical protein EE612_060812 [Oryza sativa]|nr:hypothetical protein EE612_060812 [Oryza sativa]
MVTWDERYTSSTHDPLRSTLVAHVSDSRWWWSNECKPLGFTELREICALRKKTISWRNLGAGAERGVDDGGGVEVALPGGRRAEADGLVGGAHVEGPPVGVAVDGDGGDPEPPRRPHHPARDLPPVRHKHLLHRPTTASLGGG